MSFRKSSFDQDPMEATGSFTGTFDGDGSSLTGVSSSGGSSETASHVAGADVFVAVQSSDTASFLTGSADTILIGPIGADDLTFRTDGTNRWKIVSSSGHLVPSVDLAANIGVLNGPRPKDMECNHKN